MPLTSTEKHELFEMTEIDLGWGSNTDLEKAMAPRSSTLAWKNPWTEETGRLPSIGSLRVGHD